MALQRHRVDFEVLSPETLALWRKIPPAVAGDCMNRAQCMAGAIKPVAAGMALVGQARTVWSMVGDNSISHAAVPLTRPGEVLVIAAGGVPDVAVWGGVATRAAIARGIAGVSSTVPCATWPSCASWACRSTPAPWCRPARTRALAA